jgi:hypothetical protein
MRGSERIVQERIDRKTTQSHGIRRRWLDAVSCITRRCVMVLPATRAEVAISDSSPSIHYVRVNCRRSVIEG